MTRFIKIWLKCAVYFSLAVIVTACAVLLIEHFEWFLEKYAVIIVFLLIVTALALSDSWKS